MVDLPKIPKRNELTPQVTSSVGAGDYAAIGAAWQRAANSVAQGAIDLGTPLAQEEGRKAVVRDETGALKVEMPPIVGPLGEVARKSAEAAFAVQAQGEVEKGLLELRNKTWLPVEQGGGGGDPRWFDRVSSEFINNFAGKHRGGFQSIVQQMGVRVANQHSTALINQRETIDVKNQNDVLKGREAELQSRLATLAFDNGTDSDEFRQTVTELQAIRGQRAADPRFGYSPAEAQLDGERDARMMRGMAVVGQARRDYQGTGDLLGAQQRAEQALEAAGIPIDERGRMLGQINSNLSGMAAVRNVQKQEYRDRSLEMGQRLKVGEKIDEKDVRTLAGEMERTGMFREARQLRIDHAINLGTNDVGTGTAAERVAGLNRARGVSTVPVASPNPNPNLPAGMRNNNPGNIKFIPQLGSRYGGVLGPSQNTDQGDPQAVFATPEDGMRAMVDLAMRKYDGGKTTANQLIAGQGGWTPGHTAAAANIASMMGLGPNDDLNLKDPEQRFKFARALMQQEHGDASKQYTDDMVRAATRGEFTRSGPFMVPSAAAQPSAPAPDGFKVPDFASRFSPQQAREILIGKAPGKDRSHIDGFTDDKALRLAAFLQDNPHGVTIISGARSVERQKELWDQAVQKYGSEAEARKWVAPPGKSQHNHGQAADLRYASDEARKWAHENASKYGLSFPLGNEPWHVEVAEARGRPAPGAVASTGGSRVQMDLITQARVAAAQKAFDASAKAEATNFRESFKLFSGPSREQAESLMTIAPEISDPELRNQVLELINENRARMATLTNPKAVDDTIAMMQIAGTQEGLNQREQKFLGYLEKHREAQEKELTSKPYLAGTRMDWEGEAAPRTMKAAALPLQFNDPNTLKTQIESRSTGSQLLEARFGRPASSLIDKDDAEALRGAMPGMDAKGVSAVFSSLAAARKETIQATLADKDAREALVAMTKTTDPVRFQAAMQGLDMIMRRDEGTFIDKMDGDTLDKVLKWRDTLAMSSDPKEIQKLISPVARGKEDEIAKSMRQKGERVAREMDDADLRKEFTSMWGRITMSNPDQFLTPGEGQATAIPLPQNALRADLANAMGEFMASGMSEDAAKTAAMKRVQKAWSVSTVTGQIMKHAPDKIYQGHFGFSSKEMDEEVQGALREVVGSRMTPEAAAVLGGERYRYTLVPSATTQTDLAAWKQWEDGGKQGPAPRPPGYQVMFEDTRLNPPQLRMVEDPNGQPRLFRWDTAKKQGAQRQAFEGQRSAQDALQVPSPTEQLRQMREPR